MTKTFVQRNLQATEPTLLLDRPNTREEAGTQRAHKTNVTG
jgi:hypothetical protein